MNIKPKQEITREHLQTASSGRDVTSQLCTGNTSHLTRSPSSPSICWHLPLLSLSFFLSFFLSLSRSLFVCVIRLTEGPSFLFLSVCSTPCLSPTLMDVFYSGHPPLVIGEERREERRREERRGEERRGERRGEERRGGLRPQRRVLHLICDL